MGVLEDSQPNQRSRGLAGNLRRTVACQRRRASRPTTDCKASRRAGAAGVAWLGVRVGRLAQVRRLFQGVWGQRRPRTQGGTAYCVVQLHGTSSRWAVCVARNCEGPVGMVEASGGSRGWAQTHPWDEKRLFGRPGHPPYAASQYVLRIVTTRAKSRGNQTSSVPPRQRSRQSSRRWGPSVRAHSSRLPHPPWLATPPAALRERHFLAASGTHTPLPQPSTNNVSSR